MTLVTRFSVFFLVALALALAAFSGCLYYLVGLELRIALDADLEATLDGFPASRESHSPRVSWAVYGDQGQRVESISDDGRPMILDGRDLTPLAIDVATTILDSDGSRWRILVRPMGGRRHRSPREGHRPGFGKDDEDRSGEHGKDEESAGLLPGPRDHGPGFGLPRREHGPAYLAAWASLTPVEGELRTLAAVLPVISIGLWSLATIIGQRFGRRALAPLSHMADAARTMVWTDGKARLPSPGTRDELEAFAGSFNGLLDRLDEALERQKQFTGQASHQLRTPLAALIATIDVTRRRGRTLQEHERVLDRLHTDALRLWRIVEALLFLARADAEAGMPDLEQIEISAWVANHLQGWSGHERAADLHGPESLAEAAFVQAHPALLGQLLDNLLENACKYSAPGSSIDVKLRVEAGVVVLVVEDQGFGIPPADLPRVFEPFYRSLQAQLGHAGVGLGLAVVQRIATALGGTIRVQSQEGRGSCFELRLSVSRHLSSSPTPHPTTATPSTLPNGKDETLVAQVAETSAKVHQE